MESALEMKAELGDLSGFEGDVRGRCLSKRTLESSCPRLGSKKSHNSSTSMPLADVTLSPLGLFHLCTCGVGLSRSGPGLWLGLLLWASHDSMCDDAGAHTHMHIPGF